MTHSALRTLNKAAITLLALAALQGTAHAVAPPDDTRVTVSFAELNVNSSAGAEKLYHRIASAAEKVCGPTVANAAIGALFARKRCISESIARAVAQVDAPALTRYFENDKIKGAQRPTEPAARTAKR
jgi:UrcA family protein